MSPDNRGSTVYTTQHSPSTTKSFEHISMEKPDLVKLFLGVS